MVYGGKYLSINFCVLTLFLFINTQVKTLPFHIVVLGSSTAHGAGATSIENSWVGLLKEHVRGLDGAFKVTNLAKSRITSYHILPTGTESPENRPKADSNVNLTRALSMNPSIIIVNLPSNDMIYNYHVMEQYNNFVALLCSSKVPIYFTTAQPRNTTDYNRNKLRNLTEVILENLPSIDFWTGVVGDNNRIREVFNSGDDIHLNDMGHSFLFERVKLSLSLDAYTQPGHTSNHSSLCLDLSPL